MKKLWKFTKKMFYIVGLTFLICVFFGSIGSYIIYKQYIIPKMKKLPSIVEFIDKEEINISKIYDTNDKFYSSIKKKVKINGKNIKVTRIIVPLNKISKHVINCLISTEDRQFYKHNGISYQAIAKIFLFVFTKL